MFRAARQGHGALPSAQCQYVATRCSRSPCASAQAVKEDKTQKILDDMKKGGLDKATAQKARMPTAHWASLASFVAPNTACGIAQPHMPSTAGPGKVGGDRGHGRRQPEQDAAAAVPGHRDHHHRAGVPGRRRILRSLQPSPASWRPRTASRCTGSCPSAPTSSAATSPCAPRHCSATSSDIGAVMLLGLHSDRHY